MSDQSDRGAAEEEREMREHAQQAREHEPAERGPDGARDVESDAVKRHRRGQLRARHKLRHDGLPRGRVQRRTEAEREDKKQ